jgi:hypothetical protein
MDETGSTNGEKKNSYIILIEKPTEKRPLKRSVRGWKYNIRIDFKEIG